VDAETLNRGRRIYIRYCQTCHGEEGNGKGPSSWGQWPSPRNFQSAKFKFAGILDRGLPHDDQLVRVIRGGLRGTAMKPWDLPENQIRDVIQYIKTFSPPGRGFRDPDLEVYEPVIPDDPWSDRSAAIARGEELYHSIFQCSSCHPQFVSDEQFAKWKNTRPRAIDPLESVPKAAPGYGNVLLPPDFRVHPMRSVAESEAGYAARDLYRVVAFGLQGPMPGYVHLGEKDVWAVAHYVKSIADQAR
jgi:mono/diheme cytochrome c family protein